MILTSHSRIPLSGDSTEPMRGNISTQKGVQIFMYTALPFSDGCKNLGCQTRVLVFLAFYACESRSRPALRIPDMYKTASNYGLSSDVARDADLKCIHPEARL